MVDSGGMSDTQLFLHEKLQEASKVASEAHESASVVKGLLDTTLKNMESRDQIIRDEISRLRESLKDTNDQGKAVFTELTKEIKELNVNFSKAAVTLSRVEEQREDIRHLKSAVDGHRDRLSAYVEHQSKENATFDVKYKGLIKSTARDYTRLEQSILSIKTELKTVTDEMRSGISSNQATAQPLVEYAKFLKWLVTGIIGILGLVYTIFQVYDRIVEPPKTTPAIEATSTKQPAAKPVDKTQPPMSPP
jgi:chromosome segregation ATPase